MIEQFALYTILGFAIGSCIYYFTKYLKIKAAQDEEVLNELRSIRKLLARHLANS